jgi:hypothetical protein
MKGEMIGIRVLEVLQDNSISLRNSRVYGGLASTVIVDQSEALAVTTGLTDRVYLVCPTGIQTVNHWVSKPQPFTLPRKV